MSGIALLLAFGAGSAGLGVTASPPSLNSGASTASFATASVQAIPAGGTGPYTYAWTVAVAPLSASITINSPTASLVNATLDAITAGDIVFATIRCTVTDTATSATAFVDVGIQHTDRRLSS